MLREQWIETAGEPGQAVYLGLLCCSQIFGTISPTREQVSAAVLTSGHDYDAFCALRLLSQITPDGTYPDLDSWKTRLFLGIVATPERPKGRQKFDLRHRDILIASQVQQLEVVGFRPTRNSGAKRDRSGCDVVATATHRLDGHRAMTYVAVEGVWKRRGSVPLKGVANEFMQGYLDDIERRRSK